MDTEQEQSVAFEKMRAREAEIMQLLGCKSADRLIHDLRNLLNELTLLKAVAEIE